MGKRHLAIPVLLIPVISFFILYGAINYAESEYVSTVDMPRNVTDGVKCDVGTILSKDMNQCLPICPEGTIFEESTPRERAANKIEGTCVPDVPVETYEIHFLIGGIAIAAVATGIGLVLTWKEHKKEDAKRTQELLQTYSEEITRIQNQEKSLKTQLDCEIYASQYLDTLEKLATLKEHKIIDDNAIVYFDNNFAYGRSLWWWYYYHIHGIKNTKKVDELFEIDKKPPGRDLTPNEEKAIENFLKQDRWPLYRKLCNDKPIEYFKLDFSGYGGHDDSRKNWRILPDLMYYDYEEIPEEDGLTKAEFVEIIRPYAKDLADFVDQEKEMSEPEQFEVYAEQYLETLEQIATLYKNNIIPRKASEYFENKFAYGCNLWEWYHGHVLKFKETFFKALWNFPTDCPDVPSSPESVIPDWYKKLGIDEKIITEKMQDWGNAPDDAKKDSIKESISAYVQRKKIFHFLVNYSGIDKTKRAEEIDNEYHVVGDKEGNAQLWSDIRAGAVNNFKKEHDDIWKIVIRKTKNQNKNLAPAIILEKLEKYVVDYTKDERWKDFRWWCHEQNIIAFDEDSSEGLILPKKMWLAKYD